MTDLTRDRGRSRPVRGGRDRGPDALRLAVAPPRVTGAYGAGEWEERLTAVGRWHDGPGRGTRPGRRSAATGRRARIEMRPRAMGWAQVTRVARLRDPRPAPLHRRASWAESDRRRTLATRPGPRTCSTGSSPRQGCRPLNGPPRATARPIASTENVHETGVIRRRVRPHRRRAASSPWAPTSWQHLDGRARHGRASPSRSTTSG